MKLTIDPGAHLVSRISMAYDDGVLSRGGEIAADGHTLQSRLTSLVGHEREIAGLVAAGRTNPLID